MSRRKLSLKWFGSLSNLSIHRSKNKTEPHTASKQDEKHDAPTVSDQSMDDIDGCLRSPGYARSCDMYTHVGTVPRKEKQRSTKGSKKTQSSQAEMSVGQSQCQQGDYVRDSPLLSALSSASVPCLAKPLPIPLPTRSPPPSLAPNQSPSLTSDALASNRSSIEDVRGPSLESSRSQDASLRFRDPLHTNLDLDTPSEMVIAAPQAPRVSSTLTQDLYVVMDPVNEVAHSYAENQTEKHKQLMEAQETAKSHKAEILDSELGSMDSSGEYVKFSKERFWLEPPPEKLRRELEEELKLSSSNLRSHAWYHGCVPWEVSETLVLKQGDFLIRDSLSSRGDYVLTSRWNSQTLHFLISKTLVQSGETYTRVQYTLEGEAFDSVPALVHFYVGNKAALTQQSGAQIHGPVNRTLPLRYLETAFSLAGCVVNSPSCQRGRKNRTGIGVEKACPMSPSSLHHREAAWSCGPSVEHGQALSPVGEAPLTAPYSNIPQSRSPCLGRGSSVRRSPSLPRSTCEAQPCPSPNSTLNTQWSNRPLPPRDDGPTETEANSYTELYPSPPLQSYVDRLCADEWLGVDPQKAGIGNAYFTPVVETVSAFRPCSYRSHLMPPENKPLEVTVLRRVKELLAEMDPKTAAKYITKADCTVARILEVSHEVQMRMGVTSGMELLTLPHGHQLRLDLMERFHTMSIMLAVHVLGCTGTTEERAALLHKTIQIAAELKSYLGNMFGFAAIMRALELPQISRLEQTWTALRQWHTEGAILYEKTLKPFMKSLNDGKESCPLSNTSFPHVVPLLSLLEKSVAVGDGSEPWETVETGVDVVMCHLGAARTIAQLGGVYRSNAESKLQGFQEQPEALELFLTEFQMRLLWGSRGAGEKQAQRYAKFDQVLTALSNKLEPTVRPH